MADEEDPWGWGEDVQVDWTVYVTDDGEVVPRSWDSLKSGKMPWSALDMEEVTRGQLRNRNGNFGGLAPRMVPQELIREQMVRAAERAQAANLQVLPLAIKTRVDLMQSPAVDSSVRLRAAIYAEERVLGKIPDKVEMTATVKPWEEALGNILVEVKEQTP